MAQLIRPWISPYSSVGAAGGTLGSTTYDSGPTGLQWGTTGTPPDKTIQFSGSDAEAYAVRMEVIGADAQYFRALSINGDTRDTPYRLDGAEDLLIPFDEGQTGSVTIEMLFRDGYTESSCTVNFYDVKDNSLMDTITMSGLYSDAFRGTCAAVAGQLGCWSAKELTPGTLGNDEVALEDLTGSEPDILTAAGGTSSQIITTTLAVPSLAKSAWIGYGSGHSLWLESGLSGLPNAGIVVWYDPDTLHDDCRQGLIYIGKHKTQPEVADDIVFIRGQGWGPRYFQWRKYSVYSGTVLSGSGVSPIPGSLTGWRTTAWRRENGNTHLYISNVGEAFGGIQDVSTSTAWVTRNGLTIKHGYYNGPGYIGMQVAGIGLFTAASEAELEAIHDGVQ